jgi:hypothetical protein
VKRIVYEIKNPKVLTVIMGGDYVRMTNFGSILGYVKPKIFKRYLTV